MLDRNYIATLFQLFQPHNRNFKYFILLLCIDLCCVLMLGKCLKYFINYTCEVSLSGLKGAHKKMHFIIIIIIIITIINIT